MTDTTNAGPVLPQLSYMLGLLTTGQHERIHEWGRQCWNACDEQVAGPLRERVAELERGLAESISAGLRMMEAADAELDRLRAENEALRDLLCCAHAGALAYRDDDEMQDNTAHPFIDFKRDAPDQIRAALGRRSEAARAAREGK